LTGNADSVAEMAMLRVLALMRRLDEARAALRERRWGQPVGRSLVGSTVLVVGLGAAGTAIVNRLRPFGARITAVRAHPERGPIEGVAEVFGPGQLTRAVADADVIICCASLQEASQNLFDAAVFEAARPGSVFVNVARGGLLDEEALLRALNSGRLAGAGLDVLVPNPPTPARLSWPIAPRSATRLAIRNGRAPREQPPHRPHTERATALTVLNMGARKCAVTERQRI
jgi:phosphoglycerate dehydrogenase-like enzyme